MTLSGFEELIRLASQPLKSTKGRPDNDQRIKVRSNRRKTFFKNKKTIYRLRKKLFI